MDNTGTWYTKTRVNDDFTVNKKKNKNKNYNNNTNAQSNTNEKSSPQEPKKSVTNPTALLSMFPTFDKETILDIYEHNGKNFDKTVQILKDLTADAEQPSPLKSDSPGSDGPTPFRYESTPGDFVESPGKRDYDMLQEHDDLCDQVSEILDSAFDRSDIGEDDIQELLLMCEENVCFVIEEEQKLREPKNEEYEADQITKEVQEFILRAIQNEQKSTKVNTSLSNFPSLNSSNWKEESYTSTTPFAKIVNKEHNKKQMKIQPNVPDKWGNEPNNQIHSGNKAGSTREIIQLCKHFPSLPLNEIKTVYSLLDEDYEFSLNFLKEKRRKAYQSIPLMKPKTVKKVVRVVNNQGGYEEPKVRHDETVEAILKDYTYQEIRENVQRLTRIKCILDRTATQARGSRKYNEVARIEDAALGQTHQLDKFSKASKKYVLDKARKNKEFYAMDLHGLYWDEAREVVIEQINYLSKIADGSRGQFSYIDRIKNGQKCMEYAIITGKGLNSRNNVPVLYNGLCNFLKEKHLAYTPLLNEGRVVVYIPM